MRLVYTADLHGDIEGYRSLLDLAASSGARAVIVGGDLLPHAIKLSRDGVVYVADRINNRVQLFTREGKFLKQVRLTNAGSEVVPVPAGFAFSPDPKQQYLYVVDSGPMRIVIFDRATMTAIGTIGMRGPKPGDFDIVHHMAADSKGNLYTAEIVTNRRAQRFILK